MGLIVVRGYNGGIIRGMRRKLSKHGNSLAFVIEKPVLELLGYTAETEFEVSTNGRRLTLVPVEEISQEELRSSFDRITKRYGNALRNLAK